jgi:hypothetical protein
MVAQHCKAHVRLSVVWVDARGYFVRFHRLDVARLQKRRKKRFDCVNVRGW